MDSKESYPLQSYGADVSDAHRDSPGNDTVSVGMEGMVRAQGGLPGLYDTSPTDQQNSQVRKRVGSAKKKRNKQGPPSQNLGLEATHTGAEATHTGAEATVTEMSRRKSRKSRKNRPGFASLHQDEMAGLDAFQMADTLLQDPDFVDAGVVAQTEEIKELHTPLSNKILIKERVHQSQNVNERRPGWFTQSGYSISLAWRNFKDNVAEVRYSLQLWRGHLKVIEGNFGTGVTSYFVFLKWLFLFNIPMFLLVFCFLTLPMVLYRWFEQEPAGYEVHTEDFSGKELLTGAGWFNNTELYYGYYVNDSIEIVDGHSYTMLYAYLCTMGAFYFLTLVALATSLSQSYRRNYIEGSSELGAYHVSKVFCSWDYGISMPKTAALKRKSIFKDLQEYLSGFHVDEEQRTWRDWCKLLLLRLLTNLLVLGILAGCAYLLWYICITQSLNTNLDLIGELALPLCVSAINFILPFAFSVLASFEGYSQPRTELYMTMIRTILLNLVTLGVLVYFWFSSVNCAQRDNSEAWLDSDTECYPCWETFLGMEIYKLVIMDFIFILLTTFFFEFIRKLVGQLCCQRLGLPEFDIARNTLNLIYSQVLVWLGSFYSPLLSCIMILKLFIIFYVKRASVVQNCIPPAKAWKAGRTHTIILGLLSIAFLFCFGAQIYSLGFMEPSKICGPYTVYSSSIDVIKDLADEWATTDSDTNFFQLLLELITSVAALAFLLILLCVVAHFSRTSAKAYQGMVTKLKNQIALEGKDKKFLLKLLQEASHTRRGGPRKSLIPQAQKADPRGQAQATQHTGPLSESHNPSYRDHSLDSAGGGRVSMAPDGPEAATQPESRNPTYTEGSPTSTPHLPYPQTPYIWYKA